MAKQSKQIRVFNKGIVSSVSLTDVADECAQFSLNVEPVTDTGVLRGMKADTHLYPESKLNLFYRINKMVLLDLGETEDLFLYAPKNTTDNFQSYGLNYIRDWYGDRDLGGEWFNVNCSFGVPCFAKHNKEIHIGFGPRAADSMPKWMGYTSIKQFGKRVSTKVLIDDAELKSPDHSNAVFAMDKTVRLEPHFLKRPHILNGTMVAAAGTQTDQARYKETLGADCWRYGMKIGEPFVYRIMTEPYDSFNTSGTYDTNEIAPGKFIRSNMIYDSQGKPVPLSSIAPSRKWKNMLWATSNLNRDLRVFLINVNDYYETHGWDNELSQLDAGFEWDFTVDTKVIGEYSLDFGVISTSSGENVELLPEGEWKISDILETFECSTSTSGDLTDSEYLTSANNYAFHGGTGKIMTNRLWVQLWKESGFENAQYNTVAIEPFLYSTDIQSMRIDNSVSYTHLRAHET